MAKNRVTRKRNVSAAIHEEEVVYLDRAVVSRKAHFRPVQQNAPKSVSKKRKPCHTGKRKYKDKRAADRARHLINTKGVRSGIPQLMEEYSLKRSYRCSCGWWHHTSYPDLYRIGA